LSSNNQFNSKVIVGKAKNCWINQILGLPMYKLTCTGLAGYQSCYACHTTIVKLLWALTDSMQVEINAIFRTLPWLIKKVDPIAILDSYTVLTNSP
jgi:hypothetical protein